MKLVNGYKLLDYAKKNSIVLPCFNTTNYELTYGIIKGIQNSNRGGYIQISSSNLELSGPDIIAQMVKFAMDRLDVDVPIALHLDHGTSFDDVKKCVDAGFTSIMVDASHLSFEENMKEVKKVVDYCHYFNIPVEAELGAIQGKEESEITDSFDSKTDPDKAKEFVEKTGCDLLAVSVGNVHGLDMKPNLDFDLLRKIADIVDVPLVLHGGSGIPYKDIARAKESNLIKINYGSDLRKEFISTFGRQYEKNNNSFDVKTLSKQAIEKIANKVIEISDNINTESMVD